MKLNEVFEFLSPSKRAEKKAENRADAAREKVRAKQDAKLKAKLKADRQKEALKRLLTMAIVSGHPTTIPKTPRSVIYLKPLA